MGMKGPGGPMAPLAFVPEGDPSMMGGPKAIEGGEGEMGEGGGGEGFGGDPSDFADDAGASIHTNIVKLITLASAGTFKSFGMMNPRGRGGPMRGKSRGVYSSQKLGFL